MLGLGLKTQESAVKFGEKRWFSTNALVENEEARKVTEKIRYREKRMKISSLFQRGLKSRTGRYYPA